MLPADSYPWQLMLAMKAGKAVNFIVLSGAVRAKSRVVRFCTAGEFSEPHGR
jgi:hypothetical protein